MILVDPERGHSGWVSLSPTSTGNLHPGRARRPAASRNTSRVLVDSAERLKGQRYLVRFQADAIESHLWRW